MENGPNHTHAKRRMVALVLGCALIAPPAALADDARPQAIAAPTRNQVLQGARVFAERCSGCHGDDARGDIGPNLTDAQWVYGGSASAVRQTVSEGRPGGMPAWRTKLSAEEIDSVVAFVKGLQPR